MYKQVYKHRYTQGDIALIERWCKQINADFLVCYYAAKDAPSVEYKYCHTLKEAFTTLSRIAKRFIAAGYAEIIVVKNNERLTIFYQDRKIKALYIEALRLIKNGIFL